MPCYMLWMMKFLWLQFFPWMLSFQIEKWFFCGLQTFFLFPACRLTVYICVCRYIVSVCLSVFFPFVSLLIINYVARMHSSSLFKYFVGSSWISRDPSMWLYCIQVYAEQMYFQLSNWYFPRYYLPESMLLVKKIPDGN